MVASLMLLADGRIDEASPDALRLLGATLEQLRSLPPGAFSAEAPDPEASEAFRDQWEAGGRPDITGQGTLKLLDGTLVRVRFSISPASAGRFLAILEESTESVSAPTTLYTGREVLARWRAAERRLEAIDPSSDEATAARAEVERLRRLYQEVMRSA